MQRIHTSLAAGLAVMAALTLAACGDDGSSSGGDVSAEDLDGRSFVATSMEGHEIVEGSEITISFADGSVSVQAGCNTQNGGYEIEDGVLQVGQMVSTMMACDEPLMTQDEVVAGIVTGNPTIELDGDDLTLTAGDTAISLTAAS
jgi:heat shock protein HslJ